MDIWTEGPADQNFLKDVLSVWFGLVFSKSKIGGSEVFEGKNEAAQIGVRIRTVGTVSAFISATEWHKKFQDFGDNNTNGIKNLIVADADEDFAQRKNEILNTVTGVQFNVESDLFLWPENQPRNDKGDLEWLLVQIVKPEHQVILDCFDAYEQCLRRAPGKNYSTPNRKAKIFSYSEALSGDGNERKRDYSNTDHWGLDGDSEPLQPLKFFLKKHLNLAIQE
ncbi:MAG: DUF3226 domain-containing protein [Saprospiraceae bacterium]